MGWTIFLIIMVVVIAFLNDSEKEQSEAKPTIQKINTETRSAGGSEQELTAQEKSIIATLVTHNPVLGYAIGHHDDHSADAGVMSDDTFDINQTKDPMHTPKYYPAQYSWDARHKYKCGLVSFHAHSGIPCETTQRGREYLSGYVEYWTATYNYENVPRSAVAMYIGYILSLGITYMWKSVDDDMETYDFHFYVDGQYVSLMISYYEGDVSVGQMLHS